MGKFFFSDFVPVTFRDLPRLRDQWFGPLGKIKAFSGAGRGNHDRSITRLDCDSAGADRHGRGYEIPLGVCPDDGRQSALGRHRDLQPMSLHDSIVRHLFDPDSAKCNDFRQIDARAWRFTGQGCCQALNFDSPLARG
jgi:hypothetical protein